LEKHIIKGDIKMYKFIILLIGIFLFSGCSLLKIASAPLQSVKNTVPQQIEKSVKKMKCKGNIEIKENGSIYCSDGFYLSEVQSDQRDRKLSMREKIGQWISNVSGYIFWIILISIILTFCGLGAVVSGFWSATFSVGSKAFKQIVKAIQKSKDGNDSLIQALEASTDENVRKYITEYKLKNGIE